MGTKRQRGSKHDLPPDTKIVKDYATMKGIANGFAIGKLKLLVILGNPGKGKGQIVKRAMQRNNGGVPKDLYDALSTSLDNILAQLRPADEQQRVNENDAPLGPGLYIKGYIKPIKFHIRVYRHLNAPVCVDDADIFWSDVQLRERAKHISETDKWKQMEHSSFARELVAAKVPEVYYTKSPVCFIRNVWDSDDIICQAIESCGNFVYFDPSWTEVYNYIGEWFWDQEIYDYLLDKLPLLREPDIRIITKAYDRKLANIPEFPWQGAIDQYLAQPEYLLVSEFMRMEFRTEEDRIDVWIETVTAKYPHAAASRATWHRYRADVKRAWGVSERPRRIILERTHPPDEERPPDSPIA